MNSWWRWRCMLRTITVVGEPSRRATGASAVVHCANATPNRQAAAPRALDSGARIDNALLLARDRHSRGHGTNVIWEESPLP